MKKIKVIAIWLVVATGLAQMILFSCCKPEVFTELPKVTTVSCSDVTARSAVINGSLESDGGATLLDLGIIILESGQAYSAENKRYGPFSVLVSGLSPDTDYAVKAYAKNEAGTSYGRNLSFRTLSAPVSAPVVTTMEAEGVGTTTVTLFAAVQANPLPVDISFGYGPTTSYRYFATVGTGLLIKSDTVVSVTLEGLEDGELYHYAVKGVNAAGTRYGYDFTFSTLIADHAPIVITQAASEVGITTATLNAVVKANALVTSISFEYDLAKDYGNRVVVSSGAVIINDTTVSFNLGQLTGGTTYYYRITATNALGTTYGADMVFTTLEGFYIPETEIWDLEVDADGNVYVGGQFNGIYGDAFVAKFNTAGELVWKNDIVTDQIDYPRGGIIVANGVVYYHIVRNAALGIGDGDTYIDAYDCQSGELRWSTLVDPGQGMAPSLAMDANGNLYTPRFQQTTILNPNGEIIGEPSLVTDYDYIVFMDDDIFMAGGFMAYGVLVISKFDQNFNELWEVLGPDYSNSSGAQGLQIFPNDSLLIVSESFGSLSEGIPYKSLVTCYRLRADGQGLDLIWRQVVAEGSESTHIFVRKYDENSFYFSNRFGGSYVGITRMDLGGNILWTTAPGKSGSIAVFGDKVFLADRTDRLTVYQQ
ncbi:TPA: hypothetical protein DCZ15_02335 [Candidatus Falkowbacteria bacterium]|nr:MAG: Peptidase M23 [Candidatus Falkowbacteria bacterium GW2011_GWF2_43_32]HBA36692.1 hypothetical protein [Candidatus Falkowbacteria bacterium]